MDPDRGVDPAVLGVDAMTSDSSIGDGGTQLSDIAQIVLDRLGYSLVACDHRMIVLSCTRRASRLLEPIGRLLVGRALPSGLDGNVREAVRSQRPVRIEVSPRGPAAYLSAIEVEELVPVVLAIWFRPEIVRESDLAKTLRARYQLTARDVRLLFHLRRGHTNREISETTGWAQGTVRTYVYELYDKLEVHTRGAALALVDEILHPEQ